MGKVSANVATVVSSLECWFRHSAPRPPAAVKRSTRRDRAEAHKERMKIRRACQHARFCGFIPSSKYADQLRMEFVRAGQSK